MGETATSRAIVATRWQDLLVLAARLALGALFVVAGISKGLDPAAFAQEIANYQLLPALAPHLAIVLPAMEIVAGLALVVGPAPWRQAGAAAIALLLLALTGAVTLAVARGLDISCGCFGAGGDRVSGWTVARNLALLSVAGLLTVKTGPPRDKPENRK